MGKTGASSFQRFIIWMKSAHNGYSHTFHPKSGVGLAVYNRLIRSAGFQIARPGTRRLVGLVGPSGAGKSTVSQLFVNWAAARWIVTP